MIHPTALVEPGAEIAEGVEIGPYCVVGAQVRIDAGTRLLSHVVVQGRTSIGRDNVIHPFCSLGAVPQDKKYAGEPTELHIGSRNTIRECCTVNLGTAQDVGVTRIGDDNWIMAYVHVAHDCQVGDHVVFANSTQLAGHVHVGDWTVLGGFTGVHQFVHVGAHVMAGIHSVLTQDVPPFVLLGGAPAVPHGINAEGLRRRGFPAERIAVLKRAYRLLYRQGLSLEQAQQQLQADCSARDVQTAGAAGDLGQLLEFLRASRRGIVRP
ncbi:MAG: acyl-ACP--UDP-N-acetylglucosamine O-acyltransferase [Betaproteobacteria bacterium]|nr:acyl-ACP--UDP-N-acetylglucosamine O-acyltransferase [Betaproteobacteria bacterium]